MLPTAVLRKRSIGLKCKSNTTFDSSVTQQQQKPVFTFTHFSKPKCRIIFYIIKKKKKKLAFASIYHMAYQKIAYEIELVKSDSK